MKRELLDAAADWHNRLDEEQTSFQVHAELDAWLAADPEHRAAFDAVDDAWLHMESARLDPRILEMRRKVLDPASGRGGKLRPVAAAAALLALLVGLAWLIAPKLGPLRDISAVNVAKRIESGSLRTAVGERSKVTLSDGSMVVLNTNSRVDIRLAANDRRVRLLSGQAWFEIANDPHRPFVVEAGDQRVTALGTAFDIRLDEQRGSVQVTLVEGRVAVEPIASPLVALLRHQAKPAELVPGEALIASRDAPVERQQVDVAKVSSWRRGQVVFDNDTLATAVAEMNRYSSVQIELADARLAAYRVSGVFEAGHEESLVETVTGHYPIRVAQRNAGRIVLAPAGP